MANCRKCWYRQSDGIPYVDISPKRMRLHTDFPSSLERYPHLFWQETCPSRHHPHDTWTKKVRLWITVSAPFWNWKYRIFKFSVLHKILKILLFPTAFDRFWLIDRKAFHKPAEFLTCQEPGFRSIPGPLEPAASIKPFLQKYKPILVKMQCFEFAAVPSTEKVNRICVGIEFVNITYDRHEAIKTLAHICPASYHEDLWYTGQVT